MRLATEAAAVSEAGDVPGAVDLEEEITEPMAVVHREAALAEVPIERFPTEAMVGDMVVAEEEGDTVVEEEGDKAGGNASC